MVGVVSNRTVMLLLAYFAELVISSLTIKASGIANTVGGYINLRGLDCDRATGFPLKQQPGKVLAQVLEILFKFHALLMIEEV